MGNFIDMAAVLAPESRIEGYLATHAEEGSAQVVAQESDRALVIYDDSSGDFARIRRISKELSTTAFALHIHDDDLWLYELYSNGNLVDRFNAHPHYWQKLSAAEAATWKGSPSAIVAHWPGVSADQISRYLRPREEAKSDAREKAYQDDEFESWDCWQVCDFLRKLGAPYPG
jgi:hypothetical protein